MLVRNPPQRVRIGTTTMGLMRSLEPECASGIRPTPIVIDAERDEEERHEEIGCSPPCDDVDVVGAKVTPAMSATHLPRGRKPLRRP